MSTVHKFITAGAIFLAVSCSEPPVEKQIEQLEKEIQKTEVTLKQLEAELKKLNGEGSVKAGFDKLVSTINASKGTFNTFIEMPGKIISRQNILVGPEVNGNIVALYVTNGQMVQKGQVIAKVDDQLMISQIAELESSLSLANDLYERQQKLWEQKVGSELQFLQAKNNKENLEKRLATLQTQMSKAVVRAPMTGVVDEVYLKLGEMAGMGSPICRMVNLNDIYIEAEVSEKYIGRVKKGDAVEIFYPSFNKSQAATVSAITQVINPGNRTFKIEVKVANTEGMLKPNLLATVRLKDYSNKEVVIVPTKLVQLTSSGAFIFIVEEGVAQKRNVKVGKSYGGQTEVLEGLDGSETIIDLGFREVTEGDKVQVKNNN
jgi:membrane fusion protein, multidrug efflux system